MSSCALREADDTHAVSSFVTVSQQTLDWMETADLPCRSRNRHKAEPQFSHSAVHGRASEDRWQAGSDYCSIQKPVTVSAKSIACSQLLSMKWHQVRRSSIRQTQTSADVSLQT